MEQKFSFISDAGRFPMLHDLFNSLFQLLTASPVAMQQLLTPPPLISPRPRNALIETPLKKIQHCCPYISKYKKMSLDVSSSTPGSSSGLRQPSARTTPPAPLTKPQSFSPLIAENKENASISTANRTSPRNKPTIADVSGLKRKADAVPLTARPSVPH